MFIVMGTTGEYSDRSEWVVCAYESEEMAKAHADQAQREAKRVEVEQPERYEREIDARAKAWDPDMSIDYTGTSYYVVPCPVRAALPDSNT